MHVSGALVLAAAAAQLVFAAPTPDDAPIVINWSLLETHEVLDLGNGVKALGAEIASANEASRVKRSLGARALNYCGASSFYNKSSGGSPRVSDCAVIRDTGYRHVGYFVSGPCWLPGSGPPQGSNCYNPWMWYGTCIFGANSDDSGWAGGEDIGDLVRDSINKFQWNGLVGAEGTANCVWATFPNERPVVPTNWAIWHT